jgi:3-oxoacyl-[acyl-carrier-protein] synthase II
VDASLMAEHNRRRVAVTGVGVACGAGTTEADLWDNLLEGRTAIGPIQAFDASAHKVRIASEIDNAVLAPALEARNWKPSDRALDLAIEVSGQALSQAGWVDAVPTDARQEIPVIFGTGVGPAESLYNANVAFAARGVRALRPTTVPRCMANSFSSGVSIHYGLTGANYVLVSACASGTNAIGTAYRMVRDGYADVALCGGTESFFDPFYYGVWNRLGVLSGIEDPAKACRPFDADRAGCVLGEGAAALVLESLDGALDRGARVRGEIVGYGETSDATHLTNPSVSGQARAIRLALEDAEAQPEDIGFINAHGTATRANDSTESASIRAALGSAAESVPVGANKSYFGHTLGASGAIETVVTLLGLEQRQVPPNLNLDRPDPDCRLRFVGDRPETIESPLAMKNSFGFGGGNAVLVLKRYATETA